MTLISDFALLGLALVIVHGPHPEIKVHMSNSEIEIWNESPTANIGCCYASVQAQFGNYVSELHFPKHVKHADCDWQHIQGGKVPWKPAKGYIGHVEPPFIVYRWEEPHCALLA